MFRKLLVLFLFASQAFAGSKFYIKPSGVAGDGLSAGTAKTTWATAFALMTGNDGDTLMVEDGVYTVAVNGAFSGVPSGASWANRTVIRGSSYRGATIRGAGSTSSTYTLALGSSKQYISIERLTVVDGDWASHVSGKGIYWSECKFDSASSANTTNLDASGTDSLVFADCWFNERGDRDGWEANWGDGINGGGYNGNSYSAYRWYFLRDTATGFSHNFGPYAGWGPVDYVYFKDCEFSRTHGGAAFYNTSAKYVYDGCRIFKNGGWGGTGSSQSVQLNSDCIVRYCLIQYDTFAAAAYSRPSVMVAYSQTAYNTNKIRWYNNTLDAKSSSGSDPDPKMYFRITAENTSTYWYDLRFKNSIFTRSNYPVYQFQLHNPYYNVGSWQTSFEACLFWTGETDKFRYTSQDQGTGTYNQSQASSVSPTVFVSTWNTYPGYVDTTGKNFATNLASFGTDKGVYMTTVTSVLSADSLRLADNKWICDGYGIPGVAADSIIVKKAGGGYTKLLVVNANETNGTDVKIAGSLTGILAGDEVSYFRHDRVSAPTYIPDLGYYEVMQGGDTAQIPAAPAVYDGSSVTDVSFVANFGSVSGATSYQLDVALTPAFEPYVSGYDSLAVVPTAQAVTGLTPQTGYYYRVRAGNSAGWSDNSSTKFVYTASSFFVGGRTLRGYKP